MLGGGSSCRAGDGFLLLNLMKYLVGSSRWWLRIKISILPTLGITLGFVMHIASAACMRSVIVCVCV